MSLIETDVNPQINQAFQTNSLEEPVTIPITKEEPFNTQSEIPLPLTNEHVNDLKKKGFYAALESSAQSPQKLQELLNRRDLLTNEYLKQVDKYFNDCSAVILGRVDFWNLKLVQKRLIRQEYEAQLKTMEADKAALLQQLTDLQDSLFQAKQDLAASKEKLILKRIQELQTEIETLITTFQTLETNLNQKFAADYTLNNQNTTERLAFLKNRLSEWQSLYQTAKTKLTSLQVYGIAPKHGKLYLVMGWTAAIIAGWLFGIWAGTETGLAGNASLRFFLIDSFARFSLQYSPIQLLTGLLSFIAIITLISWLCHMALNKLDPSKKGHQRKSVITNENNDDFMLINLNSQDQLITSRFRSASWFGLWLKMMPYIVFIVLVIAILARSAFSDNTIASDPFKDLFNSLVNQSFGTLLTIAFSGLITLYISRVIENRDSDKAKNWELTTALYLFALFMLVMVIYHVQPPFISDIRTIAIIGFIACSFSAGMLLGYGHRYSSLYRLKTTLEDDIDKLNAYISYLSSPYKANYLNYRELQNTFRSSVVNISNLMNDRTALAGKMVTGKLKKTSTRGSAYDGGHTEAKSWLSRFVFWARKKWHNRSTPLSEPSNHIYSIDEQYYFPQLSSNVDIILQKIANLNFQLSEIDKHLVGYWRNEYIYKSINDQIIYVERTIGNHSKELASLTNQHNKARFLAYQNGEREKSLITDGFFTGLWYLQNKLVIDTQIA